MSTFRSLHARALCSLIVTVLSVDRPALAAGPRTPLTGYAVTSWSRKDGLAPGMVYAIAQDHEGYLWLGTDNGLFRFDGLRFISWESLSATPLPKAAVRVLYVARAGDIWAGLEGGILTCIRNGDLQRFTAADGMTVENITTIMEGTDGTLWVGGRGGLLARTADGWRKVSYPAGAISSGFGDASHLMVSSGEGLFETDPVLGFRVPDQQDVAHPLLRGRGLRLLRDRSGNLWVGTLGQGLWFIPAGGWFFALAAALTIGMVWAAWALHVRRIRTTFALLTGERMRLSREIHDTLLQGLVGLALQCDAMANDPEFASPARRSQCLRLRKRIDAYVREARRSICDLRSTVQCSRDLGTALSTAAEQIATGSPIEVLSQVRGTPTRYSPIVEQQLLRIGREAITNVVRHAHASHLRLELDYRSQSVVLRVADDGCGFDPESVNRSGVEHYGLTGIRERTENLNGWLTITATPGQGTALEVTVPVRAPDSSRSSLRLRWNAARVSLGMRSSKKTHLPVPQDE